MSFNGGNNPPPERVGKQVLHVLRARLGKVNGAHLIDLDGEWSVNDPLKAFKKMDDGLARFSQFIQALGHAWCLSHPPATSSIIVVTRAITDMANKAFAGGADKGDVWDIVSPWYAKLIRKIDQQTDKFIMREDSKWRSVPDPQWVTDLRHDYNVTLHRELSNLTASAAGKEAAASYADRIRARQPQNGG